MAKNRQTCLKWRQNLTFENYLRILGRKITINNKRQGKSCLYSLLHRYFLTISINCTSDRLTIPYFSMMANSFLFLPITNLRSVVLECKLLKKMRYAGIFKGNFENIFCSTKRLHPPFVPLHTNQESNCFLILRRNFGRIYVYAFILSFLIKIPN